MLETAIDRRQQSAHIGGRGTRLPLGRHLAVANRRDYLVPDQPLARKRIGRAHQLLQVNVVLRQRVVVTLLAILFDKRPYGFRQGIRAAGLRG